MVLKRDIRSLSLLEIEDFLVNNGEKKYKAKQIFEWIWKRSVIRFDSMSNISKKTIKKLETNFYFNKTEIKEIYFSKDGTIKFLFCFFDNKICEGVLIPHKKRFTVCVSSQIGCSLDCKFCATGKMKIERNLKYQEIYDQVYLINKICKEKFLTPITNIVYMGMGEPFLNYTNVLKSIEKITSSKHGLGISQKRITVSTSGISKMIKNFANENIKVNLALSLHSANNEKRSKMMTINKTNNLEALQKAIECFYIKTKIKPTYEYVLLADINDQKEDIQKLIKFCKKTPSKVNFIEYNEIEGGGYKKTSIKRTEEILKEVLSKNIIAKFRQSRGEDIKAACGQLLIKNK